MLSDERKTATIRMFAPLPAYPAFISVAKARGPQPGVLLGRKRSIGEWRDVALDSVDVPPVVYFTNVVCACGLHIMGLHRS